jgi:hypothetical protein
MKILKGKPYPHNVIQCKMYGRHQENLTVVQESLRPPTRHLQKNLST